jgi:hypothetical protein
MHQAVRLTERIHGRCEQALSILRLELDHVVREPLEELRVNVGATSLGRRVDAAIGPMRPGLGIPEDTSPAVEVPIVCRAAEHPALFPTMSGQLRIRAADPETIELRLTGRYTPPLGAVGAIADRFAGQLAATASLRGYLVEVARRLEVKLAEHTSVLAHQPLSPHGECPVGDRTAR